MKPYFRITLIAGFVLASAAVAGAAPRSKQHTIVFPGADQAKGTTAAYTCNECMGPRQNAGMAKMGMHNAAVCRTDEKIECPLCTTATRTSFKGRPASKVAVPETIVENGKGERCRFYAVGAKSG